MIGAQADSKNREARAVGWPRQLSALLEDMASCKTPVASRKRHRFCTREAAGLSHTTEVDRPENKIGIAFANFQ
jgi:hypothetical protein